jgi:hypothetical protein
MGTSRTTRSKAITMAAGAGTIRDGDALSAFVWLPQGGRVLAYDGILPLVRHEMGKRVCACVLCVGVGSGVRKGFREWGEESCAVSVVACIEACGL